MRRMGPAVTLVVLFTLAWAGEVRAQLHCDQPLFDAGDVRAGAPLTHRFAFVNRGPDAVEIVEVKPSCGCLTPRLEKRLYRPGETGEVLAEVSTLAQPDGPASWRVTLTGRGGDRVEELPLTLTARVTAEIAVRPASLVLYTDGAIGREIILTDRRARPLRIVKVETTAPQVRAKADEPRREADGRTTYVVHLDVLADYPEGRGDESLHVVTSDPDYPELKFPFTVVKRSRLRVTAAPAAVELTAPAGQPVPSRLVLLRAANGEEVEIERVETDAAAVHCDWAPGPHPTATVKVHVDPARAGGDGLRTTVHVHLLKPAPQTVDVPVTWAAR